MDKKSLLTPRTPTGKTGNPKGPVVATPVLNLFSAQPDIEKDGDNIDAFIEDIFTKPSGHHTNPKKRKIDDDEGVSSSDFKQLLERMNYLELLVNGLKTTQLEREKTANIMTRPEQNTNNMDTTEPDLVNDLKLLTKETRDAFYKLYGHLKTNKLPFSKEQLNTRLTDKDFELFKEIRTHLTAWLKTGLALSRQLEDLSLPNPEIDTVPPLLTIRTIANSFEQQYQEYLLNIDAQRKELLKNIILDANTRLQILNKETNALLEKTNDTNLCRIVAKAFKSATQAGSYLFKQKRTDTELENRTQSTHTNKTRTEHLDDTHPPSDNIYQNPTETHTLPSSQTRPLYSNVLTRQKPIPSMSPVGNIRPLYRQQFKPTARGPFAQRSLGDNQSALQRDKQRRFAETTAPTVNQQTQLLPRVRSPPPTQSFQRKPSPPRNLPSTSKQPIPLLSLVVESPTLNTRIPTPPMQHREQTTTRLPTPERTTCDPLNNTA